MVSWKLYLIHRMHLQIPSSFITLLIWYYLFLSIFINILWFVWWKKHSFARVYYSSIAYRCRNILCITRKYCIVYRCRNILCITRKYCIWLLMFENDSHVTSIPLNVNFINGHCEELRLWKNVIQWYVVKMKYCLRPETRQLRNIHLHIKRYLEDTRLLQQQGLT